MPRRDHMVAQIPIHARVCSGMPVIKGTRTWVAQIVDPLDSGESRFSALPVAAAPSRSRLISTSANGPWRPNSPQPCGRP